MRIRHDLAVLVLAPLVLVALAGFAHAQSSLGIGTAEATPPSTGLFPGAMAWINSHQQAFYRALTGAMKAMKSDPSQLSTLIGLSFAYGVFHAAGPGHGKAVISSYMIANETALRRGIVLSFVSALLQAATAIVVVFTLYTLLRGVVSMTATTWLMEVVSYGAIAVFGAVLLWRKVAALRSGGGHHHPAPAAAPLRHDDHHGADHAPGRLRGHAAHVSHDHAGHDHAGHDHHDHAGHEHDAGGHHHGPGDGHHHHADDGASCGHSHAPDPALLSGERLGLRSAAAAVWAVGLRPCSGALIVLTFALTTGLYAGGVLSVLAMAIGTALTVSAFATLAVTAKAAALRLARDGGTGLRHWVEIAGAALVLLLGLVMLSASLSA